MAGDSTKATLLRLLPAKLRVHRLVTPGTVLRRRRRLIARKRAYPNRAGLPPVSTGIATLIERLATENRGWGYQRIHGELLKPGYRVSASTIRRVLKAAKIPSAPQRYADASWRTFLQTQAAAMLATGLFPVDRTADPQSADGPGGAGWRFPAPGQGPGRAVHRVV